MANIPFTIFAIMPINLYLIKQQEELDKSNNDEKLLKKILDEIRQWGKMHAFRSVLGLAAFSILVWE